VLTLLHRHQLVWLGVDGWRRALEPPQRAAAWDPESLACLHHWFDHDLPLVVARQSCGWRGSHADEPLMLGLAAPLRWGRRRLTIEARAGDVCRAGRFASASAIGPMLPPRAQAGWRALCTEVARLGVDARVYGSYGWQQLTGMACVHDRSDIDLLVTLDTTHQADAVTVLLRGATLELPRIDGEFVFDDGSAVPWREWAAWRAGHVQKMLVKRLRGAALEDAKTWRTQA